MENRTEYSYFNKGREYEPNLTLPFHQSFDATLEFRITPGNKYISIPNGKINLGSKYPEFLVGYKKGFRDVLGSDVEYDHVYGRIHDSHRIGLLGELRWQASGGTFLNSNAVYLPDYKHTLSNETVFRAMNYRQFGIMDYYSYSTAGTWGEGHAEHAFGGFLVNKLPVIKKLRLHEYAGVHAFYTEGQDLYLEGNFGLEKRFFRDLLPLRVDFHYRFSGEAARTWQITVTALDLGAMRAGN